MFRFLYNILLGRPIESAIYCIEISLAVSAKKHVCFCCIIIFSSLVNGTISQCDALNYAISLINRLELDRCAIIVKNYM